MPLIDVLAAIRWWAALLLLGAAATPLLFYLLRRLPDRGYAFAKMAGLLLVSFLFWLPGSLGIVGNNLGGIIVALVALVALSAWAYRQIGRELTDWLMANRNYVLIVELLFLAIFALWSWVRAQNPAITATEKPMELAFLNAAVRSPAYPPLDPWLSGFAISYYYFGYVMTSVLARLAAVPEAVAFNLGIAWLTAGTAVGAFGVVYNLVAAGKPAGLRRSAAVLGLVAAIALPLAGNLEIMLEALHGYGVGSPQFWSWLDVRDLEQPPNPETPPRYTGTHWWWWRSSRVIHEYHLSGRAELGLEPIAEFPGFSFLLGDMHPHVLALPFAFLSLGVALAWWLRPDEEKDEEQERPASVDNVGWAALSWPERARLLGQEIGWPLLLFTALLLGGLSFLNTWDVLIHLFIILGAFVLRQWRVAGRWEWTFVGQAAVVALLLTVPAVLLYLPFYVGFRSQAGPPFLLPTLVRPTRLAHYLIIFGMPLTAILFLLGTLLLQTRRRPWRAAGYTALALLGGLFLLLVLLVWVVAASDAGSGTISGLAGELGLTLPGRPESLLGRLGWGAQSVIALLPAILAARVASPWLTLLLVGAAGVIVLLWNAWLQREPAAEPEPEVESEAEAAVDVPAAGSSSPVSGEPALAFVLLLVLTGVLLSMGPEFAYLKDNFGQRLNTIFKFYYQTWVLFGVAALFALDYLVRRARPVAMFSVALYSLLLMVALLFPYYGVVSRAEEYAGPPTLDGMAHLQLNQPDEYAALIWLRENSTPGEVVLEAVGGAYSNYGRVAAHTGLPTLLGWANHEYQWRGETPEPGIREPAVEQAYGAADWSTTAGILNRYGVDYVYVGPLEVGTYGQQALEKFAGRLEVAYANNSVIIYRWLTP